MKPLTMLESLIARRTELDAGEIIDNIKEDFFSDQQPILDEVVRALYTKNYAMCGELLADMLKNVIDGRIDDAERDARLTAYDDTAELNQMLFDRNEARAINGR